MSQKEMPWMVDGKPGQILGLMAAAAQEVGAVTTITKGRGDDAMTYKTAEDIKRAARILATHKIVTQWHTSEEILESKALGRVRLTVQFVAPDGSYLEHSVVNAAYGGQGRHFTIAITAAVKVIYSLALQLTTDDAAEGTEQDAQSAKEPDEQWSERVLRAVATIDACSTPEELAEVHKHESHQGLSQAERRIVIREWQRRKTTLENLNHNAYSNRLGRGTKS